MRIGFLVAAIFALIFALGSGASAKDYGRPTAILVSPIHEAQIVRGDDGKDHVEYELLVVNVFSDTASPWSARSISTTRRGIDWWSCRIRGRSGSRIRSTAASKTIRSAPMDHFGPTLAHGRRDHSRSTRRGGKRMWPRC